MYLLACSGGNDSVAMIQQMRERGLDLADRICVCYTDTGWGISWWPARVARVRTLAESYGMEWHGTRAPESFEQLMLRKKGFPMPGKTWCSFYLKAVPQNALMDLLDPDGEGTVLLGKRRDESHARAETPEFIESSDRHGDRRVWHPLAFVTEAERDALIIRSGLPVLPHRSQECAPCINANRADFLVLGPAEIDRAIALENEIGKTMFRPYHHMGATGVGQVIQWAKSPRGKYEPQHEGCDSGFCEG